MKIYKRFGIALLALVMAVSLVACGGKTDQVAEGEAPADSGAKPGEGETYVTIAALHQLEFFDALKGGVNDAANEIGAEWYFAGPQEFAPDQIAQAIDEAVASGVTGIILHGQAPETGASIDNAVAAGIPVICVNTDIDSDRLSFIGCDPYQVGWDMGEQMAELLGGKGTVIVSSALKQAQPSAVANLTGTEDAIAQYPDMKVIPVDDTSDANVAADQIAAALQANPDVVGIIGQQAYTGVGAATAVREAGKQGDIIILSRDRDTATLELIEKGEITASYAQNSYVEAYIATMWLHEYVNGNLKVIDGYLDSGINPLPKHVDSGSILITQDNYTQFLEKYDYKTTAK